ncbi:TlpA family protein disulfide reductase [Flavobacteriaceae bacterium F08102]|nr:TlpA family protein disulfide reductase [Flavobacteriaceae bacterium F08102]
MNRTIMQLLTKGMFILLVLSSCNKQEKTDKTTTNKVVIQGKVSNFEKDQALFTYDEYGLLKKTKKSNFHVDSLGNFKFDLEIEKPIKGTLDFGRVMLKGMGNNRYIYVYLEPGDSIFMEANMDVLSGENVIKNSLKLTGSGSVNSQFVNTADFTFNTYKNRRQNNYQFIVDKQGADYKRTVDSIRDKKLMFLEQYAKQHKLSPKLIEITKDEYINLATIRKINYPSSHKGYTKGKDAILPADYYDFIPKVKIADNLEEKGLPYMRFLHFFLTNNLLLEEQKGKDIDYLTFVNRELTGKSKYIYLAYSLGTDFKAEVYNEFGDKCPYPELAAIVSEKYGFLEKMLPGKPSPTFDLIDIKGDILASNSLFRNTYTYIDLWATWCKPCIAEFPYLDTLKKTYANKNISFVSISMDAKKDDWTNYVHKEKLKGIQLWVDSTNKNILDEGYNITMIPRFVLLDPDGKIVDANAPRPSDPKLIDLFKKLKI